MLRERWINRSCRHRWILHTLLYKLHINSSEVLNHNVGAGRNQIALHDLHYMDLLQYELILLDRLHYMIGELFPKYESGAKRTCLIYSNITAATDRDAVFYTFWTFCDSVSWIVQVSKARLPIGPYICRCQWGIIVSYAKSIDRASNYLAVIARSMDSCAK